MCWICRLSGRVAGCEAQRAELCSGFGKAVGSIQNRFQPLLHIRPCLHPVAAGDRNANCEGDGGITQRINQDLRRGGGFGCPAREARQHRFADGADIGGTGHVELELENAKLRGYS